MQLSELFAEIDDYQQALGYDIDNMSDEQKLDYARECCLALYQEVAELVDSFPWKPWREPLDQVLDVPNMEREAIDIVFFLHHILRCHGITADDLEARFNVVLKNDIERIHNGYSKTRRRKNVKRRQK